MRKVMSLGRGRARWYLAAFGVALVAAIAVGSLVENRAPASSNQATVPGPGWTTSSPASLASPSFVTTAPPPRTYAFPVAGNASYARTHHDYPASDIIAACGSTVRAVTDGVVLEVNRADTYNASIDDGATRGGLFVSVLGDDGVRYYGSHYRSIAAGIAAGHRVKAGDTLGAVGESGDASVCHLHFGISPPCARVGDWWVRRGAIWPWSYLDAWKRGQPTSPATEVTSWQASHGCPPAP